MFINRCQDSLQSTDPWACNGTKETCNLRSRPFQLITILAQGCALCLSCHLLSGCIFFACNEGEGREDRTQKLAGRVSVHAAAKPWTSVGLNVFLQESALLKLLSSCLEITGQKTRQNLKQRTKTKSHQPFKMAEFPTALLSMCI